MAALGFDVTAHRIAAYAFASMIAACGGILLVWQNAQISPGTAGIPAVIDILVIAVVGGLSRPIGPFVGALIYVLLRTFSPDVLTAFDLSGERFKLLIGLGFLAVVFFSPDGVLGLWGPLAREAARRGATPCWGVTHEARRGPLQRRPRGWAPSAPPTRWSCAASPSCSARSPRSRT